MEMSSLGKVAAMLTGVVLALGGCAAKDDAPPAAAGPCSIVENGTPTPKTSSSPAGAEAGTSPNISTNPEVATGYR